MAFRSLDRAMMRTATAGNGTITLGAAVVGYQSFAAAGLVDADTVHYCIEDDGVGGAWETGLGTYTAAGTTLARTSLIASSTGSKLSLSGNARVFATALAQDIGATLVLPHINVRDYGALGDGTTDDTASINSAIAAAVSAKINTVYFPRTATKYRVTSTIAITSDNVTLKGDNAAIYRDFANGPTIKFSKASNDAIYDIAVAGFDFQRNTSTTQGAGDVAHVRIVNGIRVKLTDLHSDNCVEGIQLDGGAYFNLERVQLIGQYSATADLARFGIKASKITPGTGGTALPSYVRMNKVEIFGPLTDGFAYAVWVTAGENWNIAQSYFGQAKFFDVLIEQGSDNAQILDILFDNCYIDSCVKDGVYIVGSGVASGDTWNASARTGGNGSGDIHDVIFGCCSIKGNGFGRDGIRVDGNVRAGAYAQALRGLKVTGSEIASWLGNGINLAGGVDSVVTGNTIRGNNFSNTLAGSGVIIGAASSRTTVTGNRIGGNAHGLSSGANQVYAIDIPTGAAKYLAGHNNCNENVSGIRQTSTDGINVNNESGTIHASITELAGAVADIGVKLSGGTPVIRARWAAGTPTNWLEVIGAATGASIRVVANGTDTNVDLQLEGIGTGRAKLTADPTAALHVATKQYVEEASATFGIVNGTIVESHAGNAVTFAIKTLAGADPSAADPVTVIFRNATAATGDYVKRLITAALSLTVTSGSTLGAANATPFKVWLLLIDNAGTVLLGAVNSLSGTSIMALRESMLISTTAEGGAGAADSAQVVYASSAVSSKAFRFAGFAEYGSGLTTAGTWAASPTKLQIDGPGVAKPGEVVQVQRNDTGAVATGTTAIPYDDTIPQITEGDQYMTQAITPMSAANLLAIVLLARISNSNANQGLAAALFQDATANALKANEAQQATGTGQLEIGINHKMLAATASSTTFRLRAGGNTGATTTFNGSAGGRYFGGVSGSFMEVQEIAT